MTAITVRKLPEDAKQRLRMRAAANGRSMEAEARSILLEALDQPSRVDLTWIEQLIAVGRELVVSNSTSLGTSQQVRRLLRRP